MAKKQGKKRKLVHEVIKEFLSQRPFVPGFSPHTPGFIVLAEIYVQGAVMPEKAIPGMIELFEEVGKKTGFPEEVEKVTSALMEQLAEYEKTEGGGDGK